MEYLVFAAIWIVLALLVAKFAANKGLERDFFFILAILLSPLLAFLIALVKQPDRARAEAVKLTTGAAKKCPFCAELVKPEATVCRFCGRDLPAPARPTPALESKEAYLAWKASKTKHP